MEVSAIRMAGIATIGAGSADAVVARPTLATFVYAPSARYAVPVTVSAETLFVSEGHDLGRLVQTEPGRLRGVAGQAPGFPRRQVRDRSTASRALLQDPNFDGSGVP